MSDSNRPKIGPADPETRRKKLAEVLGTPTKGEGVAAKEEKPKRKKKPTLMDAVNEGIGLGTPKVRRYGEQGETEREVTDK